MSKLHDLAAIVNNVSADDLADVSLDDLLLLPVGLREQAHRPAVKAARRRLATIILDRTEPRQLLTVGRGRLQ
jgi:hypothetical protein